MRLARHDRLTLAVDKLWLKSTFARLSPPWRPVQKLWWSRGSLHSTRMQERSVPIVVPELKRTRDENRDIWEFFFPN